MIILGRNIICHIHRHALLVFVFQAFFTKFYIPEKELYPAEVESVDKLARALVVSAPCGDTNHSHTNHLIPNFLYHHWP